MNGQRRSNALAQLAAAPRTSTTGYPWVDGDMLYAADLNAAFLPTAGGTVNGPVTFNISTAANVHVTGSAWFSGITFEVNNTQYGQYFRTNRNGTLRWYMEIGSDDPETGGNVGTNFTLTSADDAGNVLGTPLSISRATGQTTFGYAVVLPALAASASYANDAAAAAGGVIHGQLYRNGSAVMIRVT